MSVMHNYILSMIIPVIFTRDSSYCCSAS